MRRAVCGQKKLGHGSDGNATVIVNLVHGLRGPVEAVNDPLLGELDSR